MSESKHAPSMESGSAGAVNGPTPGPWFVGDIGEGQTIEVGPIADEEYPVAAVFHMRNARLIAAAPDLLAALQILLASAAYSTDAMDDAEAQARAAIAKATGAA